MTAAALTAPPGPRARGSQAIIALFVIDFQKAIDEMQANLADEEAEEVRLEGRRSAVLRLK